MYRLLRLRWLLHCVIEHEKHGWKDLCNVSKGILGDLRGWKSMLCVLFICAITNGQHAQFNGKGLNVHSGYMSTVFSGKIMFSWRRLRHVADQATLPRAGYWKNCETCNNTSNLKVIAIVISIDTCFFSQIFLNYSSAFCWQKIKAALKQRSMGPRPFVCNSGVPH